MIARIKAYLAAAGVILAAMVFTAFMAFSKGKQAQKGNQDAATLRGIEKAKGVADEIRSLDSTSLDRRFNRWVRD